MAQCIIDTTVLEEGPGIYPSEVPLIQGCAPFEQSFTFILPRDTVVSFLGQEITVDFQSFRVAEVNGLPPDLEWECNLAPDCLYDVSPENPQPDTTGCVRFFGIPNIPGFYDVRISIIADVSFVGEQEVDFNISLEVTDCEKDLDCPELFLASNCVPTLLTIDPFLSQDSSITDVASLTVVKDEVLIFESDAKEVDSLLLTEAGTYIISFTGGSNASTTMIKDAHLLAISCDDLLGAADLYWIFISPQGEVLFSNDDDAITNGGNDLPLNLMLSDIPVDTGIYELQVWDNDLLGDEPCSENGASIFFSLANVVGEEKVFSSGELEISISTKDIEAGNITCTDTIIVSPSVPRPEIIQNNDMTLIVNELMNGLIYQWIDSTGIPITEGSTFEVLEPGKYSVVAIDSALQCESTPASFVEVFPLTTSKTEELSAFIEVFPNPASTNITLELKGRLFGAMEWAFLDLSGRCIKRGNFPSGSLNTEQTINIESFPSGIYILEISMSGQVIQRKILKQ